MCETLSTAGGHQPSTVCTVTVLQCHKRCYQLAPSATVKLQVAIGAKVSERLTELTEAALQVDGH